MLSGRWFEAARRRAEDARGIIFVDFVAALRSGDRRLMPANREFIAFSGIAPKLLLSKN